MVTAIHTASNLEPFFYELVRRAIAHQGTQLLPEAECYLVQLLHRFATIGRHHDREDGYRDEALVLMLDRALAADRAARIQLLRQLGDLALYIAGYFPESLSAKLIDVDYYVQMGGTAYSSVSTLAQQPAAQSLFGELAGKFLACIDLLGEVSTETQSCRTEQDLLRLYELWQRTGSLRALNLLQKEGILPLSGSHEAH